MGELLHQVQGSLNYTRELLIVALILARTMPIIMLTPYLGSRMAPNTIKMALGVMLTLLVYPVARETADNIPITAMGFLLYMLKEVFIGLAIGFVNAQIFYSVEIAGRLIDTVRFATMSEVMVPESGGRATAVGGLLYQLLTVMVVLLGFHHVFIEIFAFSFASLPLNGGVGLPTGLRPLIDYLMRVTAHILLIAAVLAAPVAAATFITDVVFGLLNRVAPQLNAYFMSMPVKGMAGILMVMIILEPLAIRLEDILVWSMQSVKYTLLLLGAQPL
ncbi:flagellar biosynthetic protein FliR [Myxococcota bacterium]|nr:flagellar biosynthetic protein FliR [Myxococcota bacterium]